MSRQVPTVCPNPGHVKREREREFWEATKCEGQKCGGKKKACMSQRTKPRSRVPCGVFSVAINVLVEFVQT